MIISKEMQT